MHFFACVAFWIGDCRSLMVSSVDPTVCANFSWFKTTLLGERNSISTAAGAAQALAGSLTVPAFAEEYAVTLYWITNTVTSTGYGDIVPYETLGWIFSIVVQLVGKSLFGFIIGDISSALANSQISRQNFESQFQATKKYLQDQQANQAIIARVQNYFNFLWKVSRGINDINSVLVEAPFCLRTEIGFAVHNKGLRRVLTRHPPSIPVTSDQWSYLSCIFWHITFEHPKLRIHSPGITHVITGWDSFSLQTLAV